VSQLGASRTEAIAAEAPSDGGGLFVAADLDANLGLRLSNSLFLQLGYTLDQLAYPRQDFDPFALQVHNLTARAELTPVAGLRLGLSGGFEVQFAGLQAFSPFQRVATVEPTVAFDEGDALTTLCKLRWQDKEPFHDGDAYYRGQRLDLRLGERLTLRPARVELDLRHRREDIGTRTEDLGALSITLRRRGITRTFEGTYLVPYAYSSNQALLVASVDLPAGFALSADGGFERLRYRGDSVWYATGPLGRSRELGRKRRADDRLTASAALTVAPVQWLELGLRYEVIVNRSNVSFAFDDKSFTKQVLGLEIVGEL
jgi:hypothetical protein